MKHNHHNHCWHIVGKSPTTQNEVCCWCGARRIQPAESQASGIHGPHAPKPVVVGPTEFKLTNEMTDDIIQTESVVDKFIKDTFKGEGIA